MHLIDSPPNGNLPFLSYSEATESKYLTKTLEP